MSAIFGIIDFEGRPIDPEWIKSMQRDLAHRGPDGQGLYQEESMFMGHMLLQVTPESIYDKSPYEEDGLVITAHARLDEREAIMDRLGIPETERETIVDAVLLLRSFKKFGKDFVKDIYGDFAFAIWDKEKRELFCARDHIGVKPFYYCFSEKYFTFSTEIKSIIRLPFLKKSLNIEYLKKYALQISAPVNQTCWERVEKIAPATFLQIRRKKLDKFKYWAPKYRVNQNFKTEEDSAKALFNLLKRVILDHTRTLGNIGIPLSGGFDSSTIACLTAQETNKNIYTVSSVLDTSELKEKDEYEFVNAIINQYKNINNELILSSELNFTKDLEAKFNKTYSPLNVFHYVDEEIFTRLEKKSCKRVLSGLLGDLVISNWSINPFPILFKSLQFKTLIYLLHEVKKVRNTSTWVIIKSELVYPFLPLGLKKVFHKKWGLETNPYDLRNSSFIFTKKELKKFEKTIYGEWNQKNALYVKFRDYFWNNDIDHFDFDWECLTSHKNIEISYPLADRRIIELIYSIPVHHFMAGGIKRGLIKISMKNTLPDSIIERVNKGSYSPGCKKIFKESIMELEKKILEPNKTEFINNNRLLKKLKTFEINEFLNSFDAKELYTVTACLVQLFITETVKFYEKKLEKT